MFKCEVFKGVNNFWCVLGPEVQSNILLAISKNIIIGVTAVIVSIALTLSVFKLICRHNRAPNIPEERDENYNRNDSIDIHLEQNSMKMNFLNRDSYRAKNDYQVSIILILLFLPIFNFRKIKRNQKVNGNLMNSLN